MAPKSSPRSSRKSTAPSVPPEVAEALGRVRNEPSDLSLWDALEDVARGTGHPDEVLALYAEVVGGTLPKELRVELGLRAATFTEEWSEETEPVIAILARLLEIDPGATAAFERLTLLYTVAGRFEELLATYDRAISLADSSDKKARLLEEAARVARDFAGAPARGTDYLLGLFELRPRDEQLATVLEKRLVDESRHADLIRFSTLRMPSLSNAARLLALLRVAELRIDRTGEYELALSALSDFLALGGEERAAADLLRRLGRSASAEVTVRRAALERLVEVDRSLGELDAVRSSLEFLLALAETDEQRIELHRRLSSLLEQSAPTDALGHLARVLLLAPSSAAERDAARRLADRASSFGPFVAALVQAVDAGRASPEERVDYLAEAAHVTLERLGDREAAIALHGRVLGEPAAGPAAKLLAASELAKLHREAGDLGRALGFVELEAELEDKSSARRSALVVAAGLATELGEVDRALGHWQGAIAIDDGDLAAHSARVSLLTGAGRPSELATLLLARAKWQSDAERARADHVEAARVVTEEAQDLDRALGIWKTIEERFGRTYESVDAMLVLYERQGSFTNAAELLGHSLENEAAPARRLWAAQRLGAVLVERLNEPERAVAALEKGLLLAPSDGACQAALLALSAHPDVGARAAEALATALARADQREQLLELTEVRLGAARSDAERARILVESAQVADGLGLASRALLLLSRAFPLNPVTSVEGDLLRLAEATGEFVPVARAYADAVQAVSDKKKARTLLLSEGEVHASRLGDQRAATRAFRRAVEIEPGSTHAVRALVRAAVLAGEPEEAAHGVVLHALTEGRLDEEILGAFEQAVGESGGDWETNLRALLDAVVSEEALDGALEHALKRRVASWYRDRGADPDSAEMILRRAVAKHPEESSLVMLAELERRVPGRPLVTTLLALSSLRGGDLRALHEAGEVARTAVRDAALSTPVLELALQVATPRLRALPADAVDDPEPAAPANIVRWATGGLVEAYLEEAAPGRAVSVLALQAELPFSASERLSTLVRAAELAESSGDTARAVEIAESGLELVPDDRATLSLLGRLREARGELEPFIAVRRRELELEADLDERAGLHLSLARALVALDADPSAAIDALTVAVAEAPGRSEAVEALGELLVRAGRSEEAASHYETQAPLVTRGDRTRGAEMWMEAARILDDAVGDRERARRAYRASFQASPSRNAAARLAAHAASDSQVAERVEWLERQLELEPPATEAGSERRSVVGELARALVTLEDEGRARKLLEVELSADSEANAHRDILVGLYGAIDDHESLFRLLVDRSRYEATSDAKVEALRAAARVARGPLGSEASATPLLEQARLLDAASREVRTELAENLLAVGRAAEARDVLEGLLAEFGRRRVRERALLHCLLARIESALGNVTEAIVQADEAAKIERTDPEILDLVGKLALEGGDLDKAEQAYRTLALVAGRGAGGEGAESAILYELHGIALRRGESDKANELLASALEIAGRSPSEALRLEESLRRDGRVELLVAALLATESTADDPHRAELASARATILERGGDLEQAFEVRLAALRFGASDPKVIDAARRLADLVGGTDRYRSELVTLASTAGSPELAVELWTRLGREDEGRGQREQALDHLERALDTGIKVRRTFSLLEPLLQGSGERVRLERVLERLLRAPESELTDQLRSQSLYRLAELRLGRGDEARGLDAIRQAANLLPNHEATLRILGPVLEVSRPTRAEFAPVYFEATRAVGSPAEQLRAVLMWAESADVAPEILREGLSLARELGDELGRRTFLSKVASEARRTGAVLPARAELLEYVALLEGAGDASGAVAELRALAAAEQGEERLVLDLRAADILVERLADWARAVAVYESLLAIAPTDRRVFGPLFRGLRALGQAERVEAHLEAIESLVTDDDDAHLLRMERVRLEIEAGRSERAELALREVLAARPHEPEAESVLADLLARAGRTSELRQLYQEALAAAVADRAPGRIEGAALELATLEPSEREESIAILTSALTHASGSAALMRALYGLYTDDDDPSERADLLERLIPHESDQNREGFARTLIALREAALDDYGTDRAYEIAYASASAEDLATRYVERLRDKDDVSRLVEVLLELVPRGGAAAAARSIEAAELLDTRLGEPARAASVFVSASKLVPEDFSLIARAVELFSTAGEVDEALALLARIIDAGDDLVLGDALDLRARLLVRERGDDAASLETARRDLERALEQLLPEDQEEAIHRLLIDIVERMYVAAEDEGSFELARELAFTLGDRREARGELEEAIAALSRFVDAHPEDTLTLRRVSDLATTAGDHSAALAARLRLFEAVPASERAPVALAAFDAAMGLGEPMSAQAQLLSVLSERPDDLEVRRAVERMYEAVGAYRPLADLMVQEARRAAEPAVRSSLLLSAGDLYLRAEDQHAALAALEEAAQLGDENHAVATKLADAYLGLGEYDRAVEALETAVAKHGKRRTPELAALQFALARVADAREDTEAMLNWLETALMTDRNNGEVASMLAARAHDLGRSEIALRALQAVTLLKGDAPMSKAEAYFRQAQIAESEGDGRKALLLARRAIQADGSFTPAHDMVERLA